MEYKNGYFDEDNIPDFAFQPAKPASSFDTTVYDKLFENLNQPTEAKEPPGVSEVVKETKKVREKIKADDIPKIEESEGVVLTGAKLKDVSEKDETVTAAVEPEDVPVAAGAELEEATPVAAGAELEEATPVAVGAELEEATPVVAEVELDEATPVVAEVELEEATPVVAQAEPEEAVAVVAEEKTEETVAVIADTKSEEAIPVASVAEPKAVPVNSEIAARVANAKLKPYKLPTKSVDSKAPAQLAAVPDEISIGGILSRKVKYTDFRMLEPVSIKLEEDILISDVKPDMIEMLCVEGSCNLLERNLSGGSHNNKPVRLAGDLKIQALYTALNDDQESAVVSLDSRIPFREDFTPNAEPDSDIALCASLTSIDWERINERKFRVYAEIEVGVKEYCQKELDIFEGVKDEDLQLLHSEIGFTDVGFRKTDIFEVSEEFTIPEGAAEINNISCYNMNIVENHKQISGEKAMINGGICLNVLYKSTDGPCFQDFKTDFTHFIRVDEELQNPMAGGRASFDVINCSLNPKRDEEGYYNKLALDMEVELNLEYYCQIQEPCVVDVYHYSKDIKCDIIEKGLNFTSGTGTTDVTMREIIDVPEADEKIDKVIYITGLPKIKGNHAVQNRIVIEGVLPLRILCTFENKKVLPISITEELNFRADIDTTGCREGMETDCRIELKDIGFDQINNRQIAINAALTATGYAYEKKPCQLINNVSVMARAPETGPKPTIIVYAAKDDDTVWKVSKKYRTPLSRLRAINNLDEHEEIKAGNKILIVR